MEADQTLMLNSDQERKEVYSQQCRIQVMTSVSAAAFSSKTATITVGGNDEVSLQHQEVSGGLFGNTVTIGGEINDGMSHQLMEIKGKNLLPLRDPIYFNPSNSFLYTPNGPVGVTISPTEGAQEIYLRKMFVMPANHEFYCPKCRVCIDKVLFCQKESISAPSNPIPPVIDPPVRCSECFSYLIQKGKEFFTGLVPHAPGSGPDVPIRITDPETTPTPTPTPPEILKSVVYGGLAELLASLSVVTSAASADATTLNIVALAVANLIGGFFVLAHNLRDLKSSQPRVEPRSETDNEAEDKYYELLGKRENHLLHTFVAILSFLVFGLVPPIVYGFSFRESDDKDLKLAAVAAASLICITLLGIAKAYIQRSNNYFTYFRTVFFYVTSGILASLLTYVAGTAIKRLVEQLGWFEPKSNSGLSLNIPEMSVDKTGWGSY